MFGRKKKEGVKFKLMNRDPVEYMGKMLDVSSRGAAKAYRKSVNKAMKGFSFDKRVYFVEFEGDILISNMRQVKEQINAVLYTAKENDICVFSIKTGGGAVTSYGDLSYELSRIRKKGIYLHIVVDQVAASGGYLMAIEGDRITASPNAIVGSIGVIVSMPNYKQMLDRFGIQYKNYTAGKHKRNVTPYEDPTEEGVENLKESLKKVHDMFKANVKTRRPEIDVEKVGEGDTYFGQDALDNKLIDDFGTANEIIQGYLEDNALVYKIEYKTKEKGKFLNVATASIVDQVEKRILKYISMDRFY